MLNKMDQSLKTSAHQNKDEFPVQKSKMYDKILEKVDVNWNVLAVVIEG